MARLAYFIWLCLASLAASSGVSQRWAERSIYQVMTDRFARPDSFNSSCDLNKYCGGTWSGIIDKLDYIQDLGFTAVQISPVVRNIPNHTISGEAYHGYWTSDMYALNEHFGTADDLRRLSYELHQRDMYLMVEVVIDNMAQAIDETIMDDPFPSGIDWAQLIPFNEEKYYRPYCNGTGRNNAATRNRRSEAEAVAFLELNTEDVMVVSMIQNWVRELVGNYSIDGLRIHAANDMNRTYLANFTEAARIFTMGDEACSNGPPHFASLEQDIALARNAMSFIILSDGIPIVYQGQEQHMTGNYSPYNREVMWTTGYRTDQPLHSLTATLNKLRNHAISIDHGYVSNHSQELYVDNSTYATRKGPEGAQIVAVLSNQGSQAAEYQFVLQAGFAPGTRVMEVLGCSDHTVDEAGVLTVEMGAGEPKVFFPVFQLSNSGLCGFDKAPNMNSSDDAEYVNDDSGNADILAGEEALETPIDRVRERIRVLFLCIALAVVGSMF